MKRDAAYAFEHLAVSSDSSPHKRAKKAILYRHLQKKTNRNVKICYITTYPTKRNVVDVNTVQKRDRKDAQTISQRPFYLFKSDIPQIVVPDRPGEEAFFHVMSCSDYWAEFRKWMFPKNVKRANYYAYRNGDAAAHHAYYALIRERGYLMTFTDDAMCGAATSGDLRIVKFLSDCKRIRINASHVVRAVSEEHYGVAFYMYERLRYDDVRTNPSIVDWAAERGYAAFLKYLTHHHVAEEGTVRAMDEAAERGHLETVMVLHEFRREGCTVKAMDRAAKRGHFDVVRFLHHNRSEGCTTKALDYAIFKDNFEMFEFLVTHRKEGYSQSASDYLQMNLNCVDPKIFELFCKTCDDACVKDIARKVAQSGDLEKTIIVHRARPDFGGGVFDREAMDVAAANGYLDIVKFLHEHGKEGCTFRAMDGAALCRHFDVVQFLQENRNEGCSEEAIKNAIVSKDEIMVRYLYENRPECGKIETIRWVVMAARKRALWDIVSYFVEKRSALKVKPGVCHYCLTSLAPPPSASTRKRKKSRESKPKLYHSECWVKIDEYVPDVLKLDIDYDYDCEEDVGYGGWMF